MSSSLPIAVWAAAAVTVLTAVRLPAARTAGADHSVLHGRGAALCGPSSVLCRGIFFRGQKLGFMRIRPIQYALAVVLHVWAILDFGVDRVDRFHVFQHILPDLLHGHSSPSGES